MKPRRHRKAIPQRRRVFLGCEGESERAYGALLRRLLEHRRQDVHLDVVLLQPGGGDPLALVERAQRRIAASRRRHDAPYALRAILLDSDQTGQVPQRDERTIALARNQRIRLIWQRPCHEAMLLRHLPECDALHPQTARQALDSLRQRWPQYDKGLPALRLAERIGEDGVRQACRVEPELSEFLTEIGFW